MIRRTMEPAVLLIIFSLLFCAPLTVQAKENPGTTGAQFLRMPVGARPAGMGEAYTALSTGVLGLHWNPGGMALERNTQLAMMRERMLMHIEYDFVGVHFPFGDRHSFDFSYVKLGAEDTRRDAPGIVLDTFGVSDKAYSLGYSYAWSPRLSVGVVARYLKQELDYESATTYAMDAGLMYEPGMLDGFVFGVALQNVGGDVEFRRNADPLPTSLRMGVAYTGLIRNHLTVSLEAVKPRELDTRLNIGLEGTISILRLRAGYRAGTDFEGTEAFTAGAGVEYKGIEFDYAYTPFADIGSASRFSLAYTFGGGRKKMTKERRDLARRYTPEELGKGKEAAPKDVVLERTVRIAFLNMMSTSLAADPERDQEILTIFRNVWNQAENIEIIDRESLISVLMESGGHSLAEVAHSVGADYTLMGSYDASAGAYTLWMKDLENGVEHRLALQDLEITSTQAAQRLLDQARGIFKSQKSAAP